MMARAVVVAACVLGCGLQLRAHDVSSTPITWNREISRIFYDRCLSCHRTDGSSFPLERYTDVQPRAVAIRDAVLSRRMPPWGAVKGFGDFRNDQALTPEQIELITEWVQDDTPRGNNPRMLPPMPTFAPAARPAAVPAGAVRVRGPMRLTQPFTLDGLLPERASEHVQVVAELPDRRVVPLIWLYQYEQRYGHAFLLRKPLELPAGTTIRGVTPPDLILLLPVSPTTATR